MLDLAAAWHDRCLADPIVSHAFCHGFRSDHRERLAAYWSEALGGPSTFSALLGDESNVVRMHSGKGEHVEMDEVARVCFAHAPHDARLPEDPRLRTTLINYFRWATHMMSRYPHSSDDVTVGRSVPKWSWDGPVASHPR